MAIIRPAESDSGWQGIIRPPKNVAASDGQYNDLVQITWEGQAPDTVGYWVYRDGELIDSIYGNVSIYEDTIGDNDTTFTYCVSAMGLATVTGIPWAGVNSNGPGADESALMCDEGGLSSRRAGSRERERFDLR